MSEVLFTLCDTDDFDEQLAKHLEAVELAPHGFAAEALEVPLEESEWADREGRLEVEPNSFIVRVIRSKPPETGQCQLDFIGWQELFVDVQEIMHGLAYHEPATVTVGLERTRVISDGELWAYYRVTDCVEE